MALIVLTDAKLAFGHVDLLANTAFSLESGERVGLIGRNGTGKSSLLKILAGIEKMDDGLLQYQQGLRIAYVPQEPFFEAEETVFDAVINRIGNVDFSRLTGGLETGGDINNITPDIIEISLCAHHTGNHFS